ncbi:hypothetical protein SD70_17805 [Gordoniibacillus kamchatkensis]|uniref:DNA-3-methyladenine glycosylase II n=1 Tax=Gordoniibacillus kamchatkensis TaxID=1590651 RepID=A0ABR5AG51_9BACL|nr:hypothetical protein SD70_17805 [Paenibacillus sp. VKM B-2647]
MHADDDRVRHLAAADPYMARLTALIGTITFGKRGDLFGSLAKSLVAQQLSVKAAATIVRRVGEVCGEWTPEALLAAPEEGLRAAGLSKQKLGYIQGLAQAVLRKELDDEALRNMSDEEAIAALTKVKGIGRWTAEMFLIFSLGREDVLSLGDAGLRRAARWLYAEREGDVDLAQLGEKWRPYRSIASFYLWEAVNRDLVLEK